MAKYTGHTITSDSALGDAKIQRSLRFNSSDAAYLTRTPSSTGNQKVWTWSAWVKRATLSTSAQYLFVSMETNGSGDGIAGLYFQSDQLYTYYDTSGSSTYGAVNSRKYRDIDAWYHIVWQVDAANTTHRIWINGVEETGLSNNPIDYNYTMNQSGWPNVIGTSPWNTSSAPANMYLAEVNHIDGSLISPTEFGFTDPVTGVWMPKRYEGTYGTNGFYLDFSDNTSTTTLGIDKSPNGNDFTLNNFATGDSVLDTPSNNFSTLRYYTGPASSGSSLTEGNLKFITGSSGSARNLNRMGISTLLPTSGKWYVEVRVLDSNGQNFIGVGSYQVEILQTANNTRYAFVYGSDGDKYVRTAGSESIATYAASYTQNDVIGVYVDMDASTPLVSFSKNGQWANGSGSWNQSTPTSYITLGDTFFTESTGGHLGIGFIVSSGSGGTSATYQFNFGQDSTFSGATTAGGNTDDRGIGDFKYPVPSGALALCSVNLPITTSSIVRPQKHFDTLLYTGNDGTQSITGLEFQPDWVWLKCRSDSAGHQLYDSVRGATKRIYSSEQNAESTVSNGLTAFNSNGFSIGSHSAININSETYVGWCWKAGGSSNTYNINDVGYASATAAGLDGGTIDPTGASINTKCGFSIITYNGNGTAGATIAHGLGIKPAWIIAKSRSNSSDVRVYHQSLGNTIALKLNTTDAQYASTTYWNDTSPTSTTVSLGTETDTNGSGRTHVMYCWAEIPGYSKFGKYRGNGQSEGKFVDCGFRPAFLIIRRTNAARNWMMFDNKREIDNPVQTFLEADQSVTDATLNGGVLFLANGFKCITSDTDVNANDTSGGDTYIFMAFAEQPGTTSFDTFPNAR